MKYLVFITCAVALYVGRKARADHHTMTFAICGVVFVGAAMVLCRSRRKTS